MSEVMTLLGGPTGQAIGKLGAGGSGLFGMIGNIMQAKSAADRQAFLDKLAKNPQLLTSMIRSATQPLSQGLVQDVTNTTQAQLQQRGLAASPQIAGAVESQALAPFELRNQEDAQSAVFNALGLSTSGPGALPSGTSANTSSFWNLFLPQAGGSSTASPGISNYPTGDTPGVIYD